jgi:hypothetical protein
MWPQWLHSSGRMYVKLLNQSQAKELKRRLGVRRQA